MDRPAALPLSRDGGLVIMSAPLVVALGVAFGRPARTASILGDDGGVLDDTIATLERHRPPRPHHIGRIGGTAEAVPA